MKSNKQKQLEKEFSDMNVITCFQFPVKDLRTQEPDWIIFDISFRGRKLVAEHVPLTKKQVNSKKIAFVAINLDTDFSLDYHIQELYFQCIDAILLSDFYELKD